VAGTSFTYDSRGNLTSDGTRTFTFDLENHLLTASAPTAVSLAYDPAGRLQTSTAGGATTTLLYDGQNLVGEYDASGNILARYVFGPRVDGPVVWYSGAGTSSRNWLHTDNQNSVVAWSDASGNLTASKGYDPYGIPSAWTGSRFAYTGQIMIPEAQLYHYKARVYDPGLGRFLQTDPIGYASDINTYAYAGQDPINESDPSGLESYQTYLATLHCESACGTSNYGLGRSWVGANGDIILEASPKQGLTSLIMVALNQFKVPEGGGGGGGGQIQAVAKLVCKAIPSGSTTGASGSMGGIGSVVAGGEIVKNYNTGQVSMFGFGGLQGGWNGGFSGTVYTGAVYGLNGSNSNYAGGFTGGYGTVGPVGAFAESSNGIADGKGPAPDGKVKSVGMSGGASLVGAVTGGVSSTVFTPPLQGGKGTAFTTVDNLAYLARQLCNSVH
jgi:RHS repeat-associated protein